MILVNHYNSITEAELAKNVLKEHKIECMLKNQGIRYPGDFGDSFGADIYVADRDAEMAKEILE